MAPKLLTKPILGERIEDGNGLSGIWGNKPMNSPEAYVGYVTGWRWWLLDETMNNPHPCSIGAPYRWNWAGENSAGQLRLSNRLGFHAYQPGSIEPIGVDSPLLFGRVALYGDVVVHKHGYRAEKARILDTWCAPAMWGKLSRNKQVKGTFKINTNGDAAWLTLETHTELSDTTHSASPTMHLRTRSRIQ